MTAQTRLAYRPEEVADLLGVSRATVWRLIKAGDLQVLHLRGATRVSAKSLDALLAKTTDAADAA